MKYVIDKLSDLEIIKVTASGTLNQDIRKEIILKTVSALNTNGYKRLLLDAVGLKISQNYTDRTINTFDMVDSLKEIETKNHIQIAILSKDREDGHKDFVKLARSIGRVHINHFRDYDEAITWLLGGKDIFT